MPTHQTQQTLLLSIVYIANGPMSSLVPELRVYQVWDRPIGPHPVGMFEVNLFTPAQFGAFVAWLVIHRGPLSALIHPNTGDDMRDHTQLATW
jgi:DOPA 4,5-dioxygenase